MKPITLNGITWSHSRGYTPLVAGAQRFQELHPHVAINWKKRSLQEFADFPLEDLAAQYDLLIIDHPWVGCAAKTGAVLALDQYLSKEYLDDQRTNSVGLSHISYAYGDHQWALAIDAAAPVASYRKDLLDTVPHTWIEVLALAEKGKVAVPGIAIDLLMNFYMFCQAHGETPFVNKEIVVGKPIGLKALETMKFLWSLMPGKMFDCNPIDIAEMMTTTNNYAYCPFAYGYSNYARPGYADAVLNYTALVTFEASHKLVSTLGGTGLAVSASCPDDKCEWAIRYAAWQSSPVIQSGLYADNGGQPGYRQAWLSETLNQRCNNYFAATLPVLDSAYMRPRYNGYLYFQDNAGHPIRQYLKNGGNPEQVLLSLNKIYRESQTR